MIRCEIFNRKFDTLQVMVNTYAYLHTYLHTYENICMHRNGRSDVVRSQMKIHTNNTYIHTYIPKHTHTYIHTYDSTCMHTKGRSDVVRSQMKIHTNNTYIPKHILTYMHTYDSTCMHTKGRSGMVPSQMHIHTYIHTYIHTTAHAHIPAGGQVWCHHRCTYIHTYIHTYDSTCIHTSGRSGMVPSQMQTLIQPRFCTLRRICRVQSESDSRAHVLIVAISSLRRTLRQVSMKIKKCAADFSYTNGQAF